MKLKFKACLILLLCITLLGCSAKYFTDYQDWSTEPTPSSWVENDRWTFAFIDENGTLTQSLLARFTDQPVNCCVEGDWKWMEILEEHPVPEFPMPYKAGYIVEGSHLAIIFNAAICDDNRILKGHITDLGVVGTDNWSTMVGGGEYGKFIAIPSYD